MKVLSHRGWWHTAEQKNSDAAFLASFAAGFGTETDVRDRLGELVVSHDMPGPAQPTLTHVLSLLAGRDLPLAINIKADGLARPLRDAMARHGARDWFVFDMSVPDTREHLRVGNPVFVRMSEVERQPPWLAQAQGVWLDGFEGDWYPLSQVSDLLAMGKQVCVVSPELHGRPAQALWERLLPLADHPRLMLCTDWPARAQEFFTKHGASPVSGTVASAHTTEETNA